MYHSRHSHKVDIPTEVGRCLLGLMNLEQILEQRMVRPDMIAGSVIEEVETDLNRCSLCGKVQAEQCMLCGSNFMRDATYEPSRELELVS